MTEWVWGLTHAVPGQASKIYLCSHLEDVEVAVIVVVVYEGSDVVEHQLCVGVEIPVQAESDVVLLAAVGDVVLQIDARESGRDFPCSGATLAEILFYLGGVERGAAEVVEAGLAGELLYGTCHGLWFHHRCGEFGLDRGYLR